MHITLKGHPGLYESSVSFSPFYKYANISIVFAWKSYVV